MNVMILRPAILVLLLTPLFVEATAAFPLAYPEECIAIRHDRDDADYVALGEQFPSVGKVGRGGDGTLIAPQWVLTAGHVARGMARRSGGAFPVFFAIDDGEVEYAVSQVIVHPDFVPMGGHDIALLKLDRPVEGIAPVALYTAHDEQGKPIVLVGHGDTKSGNGGEWVVDRKKRGATNEIDRVTDGHITFTFDAPPAGTELEGTAGPGDSGGPAFILVDDQPHLAGVSSLGQPGAKGPGTYGAIEYFVRVSTHHDWITETMQNPPAERLVNVENAEGESDGAVVVREGPTRRGAAGRVGRGGPAGPPAHVEGLGLLMIERNGAIQMVGRIDELVPPELNALNLRPPAQLRTLDGTAVTSLADFQARYNAIAPGTELVLMFDHNGEKKEARMTKQ